MPYNNSTLIVFDLETSHINPHVAQPLEIAAVAVHSRSLSIIPGSEFCSLIRPTDVEAVSDGALKVNKICCGEEKTGGLEYNKNRDCLLAPPLEVVWGQFVNYVKKYNYKNSAWTAPIACGYNIIGYDLVIIDRLAKQFKQWDDERQCNTLFSSFIKQDLMYLCWNYFEDSTKIPNIKLGTVCELAGIEVPQAHEAVADVRATATLMIKFMNLIRGTSKKVKWKPEPVNAN
jgi:DNA polymerase III epsilon subunit-like protein